nr:ribonuclease H-like domain-containing protein [Tanacetum cinerariifolium]
MKRTGRDRDGRVIILPPTTADEHIVVQRESKARTTLLQSIPDDQMRKSMLKQEFLKFRIGEAEGSHKGYDRMQKILSQLNQLNAKPEDEDINLKFLRALPSSWSQKAGRKIDFDKKESARFNKKKVRCYKCQQRCHFTRECRAKGGNDKQRYSSFKIKEIGKKEEDSKALITVDTLVDWTDHDGESDRVIASKEFGMIAGCDTDDAIKESAAKIYNLITGADTEEASTAGDAGEVSLMGVTSEVHNCSFGCDNKYNELHKQNGEYFIQVQAYKNSLKTLEKQKRVLQRNQLTLEDKIRVLSIELENTSNLLKHSKRINADVETAKKDLQTKLDNHFIQTKKWRNSSKNMFRPLFHRFAKADSMKVVPPPLSGDYTSLSGLIIDVLCDKYLKVTTNDFASSNSSVTSSEPKPNDSTSCASTSSTVGIGVGPVHYRNKVNDQNQFVPQAVLLKTGKVNILHARPQLVPTGKPKVFAPVPAGRQNRPFPVPTDRGYSPSVSSGWWKSTARPMPYFSRPTSSYFQTYTPYVPTMSYNHMKYGGDRWATDVKPSAGCSWKSHRKGLYWENPFLDAEVEGIFDSGCSRSMTGNKKRLDDFQVIQGEKVTFGGGEGRITGKGTIRTPTLDFENVYYVKELQQFNLFSISQICDKKNRVLFTNTECLMLSKDFKLPDDSMVVLRVPRKHNLYTINVADLLTKALDKPSALHGLGGLILMTNVPTCASTVPASSSSVPVGVPPSVAPAGVSNKGKSPMVEEDIPIKARTFKQMQEDILELQRRRQQKVLDLAMYYNEEDWIHIRAQVEANASLSKTLLGDDVSEDNFPARMAALIMREKQALTEKLAKERRNRPMTQAQQRTYMRQFVKNQSCAVYSTGWSPVLEEPSSKRQKSTEAPIPTVPDIPQSPIVSSPPSSGIRRKSLGRKRLPKPTSTLQELDLDADAQTFIKIVSTKDSDNKAPHVWSALDGWEVIPTPLGDINAIYRMDRSTSYFTTLMEILHMGDLQVLFDSHKGGNGSCVWQHQRLWEIRSWRLYTLSNVYILETVSGAVLYMFADVSYPLSVKLMERMLTHKLEIDTDVVGNDMTIFVAGSRFPEDSSMLLTFGIQCWWFEFKYADAAFSRDIPLTMYVVPTGRVVVPTGRYIVPAGIDFLFETTPRVDAQASITVAPLTLTAPTLPPPTIPTISQVPQAPTPPTTASSTFLQDLPNFGSLFGFDHRLKTLEANFSEFVQTNQFVGAVSFILEIVERYMDQGMNEAVKVDVQIQSDRLRDEAQAKNEEFLKNLDENIQKIIQEQAKEQVKVQVSKILPKIKKTVNEQLEAEVLTRSSNSSKTSYVVAADLSEMELKKILIEKMESNKRRDDADKDEEPSAGSDRGSKRRREGKKPESTSAPKEKATKTTGKSTQGDLAKQADSCSSFNELMDTPVDFLAFLMNRLKVDTLTPELLAGLTYELMKGSCKSLVELEFFLKEVYKATTAQLDWNNPKGQQYPHNLLKPLPLIPNS